MSNANHTLFQSCLPCSRLPAPHALSSVRDSDPEIAGSRLRHHRWHAPTRYQPGHDFASAYANDFGPAFGLAPVGASCFPGSAADTCSTFTSLGFILSLANRRECEHLDRLASWVVDREHRRFPESSDFRVVSFPIASLRLPAAVSNPPIFGGFVNGFPGRYLVPSSSDCWLLLSHLTAVMLSGNGCGLAACLGIEIEWFHNVVAIVE